MLRQASLRSVPLNGSSGNVVRKMSWLLLEDAIKNGFQRPMFALSRSRFQSSLCSTSSSSRSNRSRSRVVDPSLKQRRPHVNGEAVAFHVRDLMPQQFAQFPASGNVQRKPASKREYDSDLIVVLDMDECLLHSQFLSNPMTAHVLAHQLQQSRRKNGEDGNPASVVEHFRLHLDDGGDLVHVNLRPGLNDFLNEITSKYETHIFTAAMPIYAKPVLDRLDPDNTKFAARWYREHCSWDPARNAYVKNLEALPLPNLARTVLVDNNPLSFLSHPSNGILVSSFYNDPNDQTLAAVIKLLDELEPLKDVRPLLENRFGMKDALQELACK